MELIFVSFFAGIMTILAPCVMPILPVILTRNVSTGQKRSAIWIILGLSVSVIIFSVLLKATTLFIDIPQTIWSLISGVIILIFGIATLFPELWTKISLWSGLEAKSQKSLSTASRQQGIFGDIVLGASLGPVFSACSPTYALIIVVVLPSSPILGLLYLIMFVIGLALMLGLVAVFGGKIIGKLGWSLKPNGVFRNTLGVILVITGILIMSGLDKTLLTILVENGWYDFQLYIEQLLI
jgi:cytochrome c-type biogenesis protein